MPCARRIFVARVLDKARKCVGDDLNQFTGHGPVKLDYLTRLWMKFAAIRSECGEAKERCSLV